MTGETRGLTQGAAKTPSTNRFKPTYSNPHSLRSDYGTFENRNFGGGGLSRTNSSTNLNSSSSLMTAAEATMGRKVKHNKFGEGTIVSVADVNGDKKLTIAFDKQGIKNLMLSMAKLELL